MNGENLYPIFRLDQIAFDMETPGHPLHKKAYQSAKGAMENFVSRYVASSYQTQIAITRDAILDAVSSTGLIMLYIVAAFAGMEDRLKIAPLLLPPKPSLEEYDDEARKNALLLWKESAKERLGNYLDRHFSLDGEALGNLLACYAGTERGSGLPNPVRTKSGELSAWILALDDFELVGMLTSVWTKNRAPSLLGLRQVAIDGTRTHVPRATVQESPEQTEAESHPGSDLDLLEDYMVRRFGGIVCGRNRDMLVDQGVPIEEATTRAEKLKSELNRFFHGLKVDDNETELEEALRQVSGDFRATPSLENQPPEEFMPSLLAPGDGRIRILRKSTFLAETYFPDDYAALNYLIGAWAFARKVNRFVPYGAKPYVNSHSMNNWKDKSISNVQSIEEEFKDKDPRRRSIRPTFWSLCGAWVILRRVHEEGGDGSIPYQEISDSELKRQLPLNAPQKAFADANAWYDATRMNFWKKHVD